MWQWLTWLSHIDLLSSGSIITPLKLWRACCGPGPELSSRITIDHNWNIRTDQDRAQATLPHVKIVHTDRLMFKSIYMHQLGFQPSVADIFVLSVSPDLYDHLLWQRASPSKPSPSLTMSAAHPESCPSRRAPRCCCINGRQKTGGRDGTMESMAWCHTSISWSRMCEC